jgi:hypothetical protein
MGKDYYNHFHEFLSDTTMDDLLQVTTGYEESCEGIDAVYEWVKENASSEADLDKFDEIFSSCLKLNGTLWFNLGWNIGWSVGVYQVLKANDSDISDSASCLAGSIYSSLEKSKNQ